MNSTSGARPKISNLDRTSQSSRRRPQMTDGRRNRGRTRSNKDAVTHRELMGGRMNVAPNPPDINYQPWCPVIVVMNHSGGELKATVNDIAGRLVDQIDPLRHGFRDAKDKSKNAAGGPLLQLKFRSVRSWNLTGHMIALSVNDLTHEAATNTDTLCGIVDTGSADHTPAVGYEFPAGHKSMIIHNDAKELQDPVFHVITPAGDQSITYVSLFWRFDGPSKFSQFNISMREIMINTSASVTAISRSNSDIRQVVGFIKSDVSKIERHSDKGGIGNAIIKGVEVAAPYVIPALAAEDKEMIDRLRKSVDRMHLCQSSNFDELDDFEPERDVVKEET